MKYAVLLVCVLMAGCTTTKVISSSPRTVVVQASDNAYAEAQKFADAECAKHSRFARLLERPSRTTEEFIFDCVN